MEEKNTYLLAIVGSLIGGILLTVPWILVYVYGNMMFSVLAVFIAWGALKGYTLCKGKINDKLPTIITVISLLSVTVAVLVIIPLMLLYKEGYDVNLRNFEILYNSPDFTSALTRDYIISIVFTFLGISGIVSNIKRQILSNQEVKIEFSNPNSMNLQMKNIEIVKEAFEKYGALEKGKAVSKEQILEEIEIDYPNQSKMLFRNLKIGQYIRKYKGNFYWSEKNEHSALRRFLILYGKMMFTILLITFLCLLILI